MTVCMALTAMTSHAQAQLKQSVLQAQLVNPVQLKADSIAMAVKGLPSDQKANYALPFTANGFERSKISAAHRKANSIKLAPANDGFCIYATVMNDESWPSETIQDPMTGQIVDYPMPRYDIYTFDGNSLKALGTDSELGINQFLIANGGGTIAGSEYLFNHNETFYGQLAYNIYFAYNLDETDDEGYPLIAAVNCGEDYTYIANQVAFDATTGKVFGQFYNARRNGYVWGTRDIENGYTETIGEMDGLALRALAFDHLGRAWAINTNNDLVCIDKNSGFYTTVGNTGLQLSSNIMTGAIDPKTDVFYFFGQTVDRVSDDGMNQVTSSHLYTIDLKTGKANFVKNMPGNAMLAGAAFRPLTYVEAAPAAATNLAIKFDKDNLAGTVSYTVPAVTVGGDKLASDVELKLYVDEELVKTCSVAAGTAIEESISVAASGIHVVQVVPSVNGVEGQPATVQKWFGLDVPAAVTDIKLENTDYNHATLSWTAPTEGIHHGYIAPAKLNYTIINSDGEVEATGLKETTLNVSKEGSTLSTRSYTIVAFSDADAGLTAQSNRIYFGNPRRVPCTFEFESRNEFDLWTVVDANEDYNSYIYDIYGMCAYYNYSRSSAADDYLFSPPIHLTTGQYYNLKSDVASGMGYYQERYAIELAKKPTVSGIFKTIHGETDTEHNGIQATQYYKLNDPFYVDEEGDYYIAYHCLSKENQLRFEVHSVQIEKGANDAAPAAATDVTIAAGDKGSLKATITFTAPTTDTKGRTLTELNKAELYNGDKLAGSIRSIEPGKTYTITDSELAVQGKNSYHLYIYNDEGKGLPVNLEVFVGSDIPGYCENTDVNLVNGNVQITWDAPTVGKNGGYVNPKGINYQVARQFDITETYYGPDTQCFDNDFPFYGEQVQVTYGIFPKTVDGEGPGTGTPTMIGGDAYVMPFEANFGNNDGNNLWVVGYDPYSRAVVSVEETPSYDADGYNITVKNTGIGVQKRNISSGKILVNRMDNPILVFAVQSNVDGSSVDVAVATDCVLEHAKTIAHGVVSKGDWKLVAVDLAPYKGKEIVLDFTANVGSRGSVYLDNVRIVNEDINKYENITNGIGTICIDHIADTYYDLSGRRTNANTGILIGDGKKVIK